MAWDRLCEVKEERGLGFKKLLEFNKAMLAKQAWRLINNVNPLVTQLMKARYYPRSDFLQASLGVNPSYVWRSIMKVQDVVLKGCRRRIGDGKDTRVWQVPWLSNAENGCLTSAMHPGLETTAVDSLFSMDGNSWDVEILNDLCNERDKGLIQQIPIPLRPRPDSWFWLPESKGKFSVRSCYRLL